MTENVNEQVDKEKYVRAYGAMVLSRTFDRKIITAQRQGRVGFYTPTMGQEATQVGASMALDKDDLIFEYYRDVPMMIHRGVPMEKLLDQIMGNSEDYAKGRQMPSHFTCIRHTAIRGLRPWVGSRKPGGSAWNPRPITTEQRQDTNR